MARKLTKIGYELSDVNIIQDEDSHVEHRKECDTNIEMCGRKVHPVIVAPMGAVTNEFNYKTWIDNGFVCVVPRTVDFDKRLVISTETFVSVSLEEAEKLIDLYSNTEFALRNQKFYICIDIAQGTMDKVYEIAKKLKLVYYKIEIMAGNVATPKAYRYYAEAGIDYMRLGIGGGSRCTTACNVGIHYPLATLIDDIMIEQDKWIREGHAHYTKVIADGGLTNFDDIQKCLALGAYAVMNGSWFAKSKEACGEIRYLVTDKEPTTFNFETYSISEDEFEHTSSYLTYLYKPYREYYGMSTRRAQKETGNVCCTKTSEGVSIPVPVEYPIAKWTSNMVNYIKSAMSYTDSYTIDDLRRNTELIINCSGDKAFRK